MLDSTRDKYVNQAMKELRKLVRKREISYKMEEKTKVLSRPQRAVVKALYLETTRIYELMVNNLALTGILNTEIINQGLNLSADELIASFYEHKEEIDLILESCNTDDKTRDRLMINTYGRTFNSTLRNALLTVSRYMPLNQAINIDELRNTDTIKAPPRGNPEKGVMVRKLMVYDGLSKEDANVRADYLFEHGLVGKDNYDEHGHNLAARNLVPAIEAFKESHPERAAEIDELLKPTYRSRVAAQRIKDEELLKNIGMEDVIEARNAPPIRLSEDQLPDFSRPPIEEDEDDIFNSMLKKENQ